MTIGWVSPYTGGTRIAQQDGVDTIVSGTTTVNYGLTNRLLAKRRGGVPVGEPVPPGTVREILTVDLRQTYYTNSLAAQYDSQYSTSFGGGLYNYTQSPSPFSPVQFSVSARPTDTTTGQFRMEYDTRHMAVRSFPVATTVEQPAAGITVGWSRRLVIPGLPGFDTAASADHFFNVDATIKDPDNGIGGTISFNYDVLRG